MVIGTLPLRTELGLYLKDSMYMNTALCQLHLTNSTFSDRKLLIGTNIKAKFALIIKEILLQYTTLSYQVLEA
jgi:hypothetical protein